MASATRERRKDSEIPAVKVECDKDGLPPEMGPGEYCVDPQGCLHVCTPDETRFAMMPATQKDCKVNYEIAKRKGLTIHQRCYFAGSRKGIVSDNSWTVIEDYWYEAKVGGGV